MYLNVFVGPYAPLEDCGPYDAGEPDSLSGFDARRLVDLQGPNATWEAAVVYAITPDDCYSIDTWFSLEGQYEEIFDQFVESFWVEKGSRIVTPTPGPLEPVRASPGSDVGVSPAPAPEGFDTYIHAGSRNAPPFSFSYPADWYVDGWEDRAGVNGLHLTLTPWDPNTTPEILTEEGPPANWVNLEIGVLPVSVTAHCTAEGDAQLAFLGTKEGFGFEGRPWPNVIAREVRAEHAGFCYFLSGSFYEPADPAIFDRITESFRFAE
jgi:hypothetical protein